MTSFAEQALRDVALSELHEVVEERRELERARLGEIEFEQVRLAYARDPLRPLREGKIKVWNGRRLEPMQISDQGEELLRAWIDCEHLANQGELRFGNVHVEKSRQVWDTTTLAYGCLWALTYHDVALLMQHQDLSEVADGGEDATWDSFFGKIRLLWKHWPEEIGRARLRLRQKPPLIRNLAREHSFLTGEGETPDPGRGGTYHGAVVDEAARIAYGEAALAALNRACPHGRVYLSTPNGEDNVFFRLKQLKPQGMTFLRHHWSGNPVYGNGAHIAGAKPKTCEACRGSEAGLRWDPQRPTAAHRYPGKLASPWYDLAVVELTDEDVARELDIDYVAALAARVYPEFQLERHLAAIEIPYDENLPLELAFDYGVDTTAVLICQDAPREYRVIGEVELHDALPEEVARGIREELRALGVSALETTPQFTRQITAIGDPAGEAREQIAGRSVVAEYQRLGFSIASQPQRVEATLRAVKRLLGGRPKEFVISQRCPRLLEHIQHNRYETDRIGTPKPGRKIKNDKHNHALRALAYLVAWKWPAPDLDQPEEYLPPEDESVRGGSGRLDEGLGYEMDL